MGFHIFLDITSFQLRRLNIDGSDNQITDDYLVNLARKWIVYWDSGDIFLAPFFSDLPPDVSGVQDSALDGGDLVDYSNSNLIYISAQFKPWMLTVEEIDSVEHLILYSLDNDNEGIAEEQGFAVNPDITIPGDGFIRQLDGGVISETGSGLTWTHLFDEGTTTPKTPLPALPQFGLQPMVLFKRDDMA